MKISELPDIYKKYSVKLTDKSEFFITGIEKDKITSTKESFIQLPNGDVINKSYILSITLDFETSKDAFKQLSAEDQKKITSQIKTI